VIEKLEANRVQLQAELSKHVVLKYTPHLNFHLDDSIERGARVFKILQEIEPPAEENGMNDSFSAIASALRENKRIAVLGHVRPDGDAFGSQLALGLSLRALGKDVAIWNEDGMLEKYSFMPCSELLVRPPNDSENFDLGVALDTAVQNRLGLAGQAVRAPKWINIDHHPTNPRYGDLNFIDATAPATGQILFELIAAENFPMTKEIAENLFVAISTDTGSFQYPNTTARTFEIGAELLKHGVNVGRVSQLLYESYPRRRIELLRALLDTMRFEANGRIACFSLSLRMASDLGANRKTTKG